MEQILLYLREPKANLTPNYKSAAVNFCPIEASKKPTNPICSE
jgi:hypothetical protein